MTKFGQAEYGDFMARMFADKSSDKQANKKS